jgi:hypothetical protein
MNELTSGRMADDVVGRRAEPELLADVIKETLDHNESPLRLGLKAPSLIAHIPEGIPVARIVSLSKLGNEKDEVVVFSEASADIARLLARATAAVHQEQHP